MRENIYENDRGLKVTYCVGIFLVELRTTTNHSQDGQPESRPGYEP